MIPLTVEQENEIDVAWYILAREQLNPLVGMRLDGLAYSNMNSIAKNIGRELSHQFYQYLLSDEQIEVTIGVDENLGIVAGWRAAKIPPPQPLGLPEEEEEEVP